MNLCAHKKLVKSYEATKYNFNIENEKSLEITMAANQGRPINAGGWYHNDFLPWIQNQDLRKSFGYGICLGLFLGIMNSFGHGWTFLLLLCLIFAFLTWMDDFLPWIQNQDLRKSFGYGICIGLFKAFLGNYEQPWSVYIFQDLLLFMIFAFSTLF